MNRFVLLIFVALFFCLSSTSTAQSISDFNLEEIRFAPGIISEANKIAYVTYQFGAPTSQYNGVIVSGTSTVQSPEGWIKWEDDDSGDEWIPLTFLKSERDAVFFAGYRSDRYRDGIGFTLRFRGNSTNEISIREAGVFDNRKDEDTIARKTDQVQSEPLQFSASTIIPPTLISRSEWNADPFIRGNPVPLAQPDYTRMTFHHAACCSAYSYEEGLEQVKAIQNFHQDVRGWSDIGYHFLMDQEGRIYQGRPFIDNRRNLLVPPRLAQGAHVGGFNVGNIGVSVLGCYHPPEGGGCVDVLSPAAKDSLVTMFSYLSENYRINTGDLFGHRDQGSTACPGDHNYSLLPQIRADIDTLIVRGNQQIAQGALQATVKDDGVVLLEGGLSAIRDVDRFRIERELNEENSTVYTSANVTDPILFVDNNTSAEGVATYRLFATSSVGQTQNLAETSVLLFNPDTFTLAQSFPNPVGGEATIRYYVERGGVVNITLYNLNGVEVQTLADGYHREGRWYTTSVFSESLASGVYYYRMIVTSFPGIIFDETRTLHVVR